MSGLGDDIEPYFTAMSRQHYTTVKTRSSVCNLKRIESFIHYEYCLKKNSLLGHPRCGIAAMKAPKPHIL